MTDAPPRPPDDAPPPFRWRNVYIAVVLVEATVIGLLSLLTLLASGCGR